MRIFKTTLILGLILSTCLLGAQENLGLKVDRYAGVNSLLLNPSNGLTSPFSWDVNLIGLGTHIDNNYAFIQNSSLGDFIRHAGNTRLPWEATLDELSPEERRIEFFDDPLKRYVLVQQDVMGPSFMVSINDQIRVGLLTRARAMVSSQTIPNEYSFYNYDRIPLDRDFAMPPIAAAGMSWSEVGLNFQLKQETYSSTIGLGATVKFLQGYEAAFVRSVDNLQMIQLGGDSLLFNRPHAGAGFTTSNIDGNNYGVTRNGSGVAFDLGLTILVNEYDGEYDFKLGFALLDIGKINFNQNAEQHVVDTDSLFTISYGNYFEDFTADDFIRGFSYDALGDSTASFAGNNFDVWLPGALSIQADYPINEFFGVNATLIQRIAFKRVVAVKRSNLLAVTPYAGNRWFGASLPISVYNWKYLRVGAAARIGFLTLGTDNLGGFMKSDRFSGADFYLALKVNPFDLGFGFGGGGGKSARCYSF